MTDTEFVEWFKGFVEGAHHFNISPKQWDYLKEKLLLVGKETNNSYIIDNEYWTTTIA
jgi:hypothetical protein